ncbi:MAG: sugar phosphate nucleotidyltransferase [Kiritimatiellia bacterium]
MSKGIQAILLVGGTGTRIQAVHSDRPKGLVPVAGKPFLQWQVEWLTSQGICDIHLAAGHLGEQLVQWGTDYSTSHPGIRITASVEPERLGTGGGLKYIENQIRSDPFLVLNGDSLAPNLKFQSLEVFHKKVPTIGSFSPKSSNHWKFSIAVTQIEESGRYGTVEFNKDGLVTAFREKAQRNAGWINAGVYMVDRGILSLLEPGRTCSLETELFPNLCADGKLAAFPCPAPLLDMGTPNGLKVMEAFLHGPKTI